MKYFSMFTGIGGFELGIGYKGECIGFSEIDKYASQLLQIKWPTVKNYGDATKIDERTLPDFDLLVGGFPCQSFSIAGKRKGFDDTRGTLFFDIARILAYKKPRNVLLENVKGLLSHDGGRTFQTIIRVLSDLGYFVEWQVLNSKNFGVPQNRERVFIVGHLGGEPRRKVFPVGEGDIMDNEKGLGLHNPRQTETTLRATDYKGTHNLIRQINQPTHSNDRVYGEEGISPTLNTMQGGRRQPKVMRQPLKFLERNQKNIEGDYSFTIDSANTGGVKIDAKIRRLTPLECERLQGFPDNWTKDFSDTQRYKMCGNAVTVNVVKYIVQRLFNYENRK
jgi:DNA (cytosine-5)-methyltransferase 1